MNKEPFIPILPKFSFMIFALFRFRFQIETSLKQAKNMIFHMLRQQKRKDEGKQR